MVIVSNAAVDLFMDAVTDIIRGFLISIGVVDMLVDVNLNMFVREFAILDPLEEFRC